MDKNRAANLKLACEDTRKGYSSSVRDGMSAKFMLKIHSALTITLKQSLHSFHGSDRRRQIDPVGE